MVSISAEAIISLTIGITTLLVAAFTYLETRRQRHNAEGLDNPLPLYYPVFTN